MNTSMQVPGYNGGIASQQQHQQQQQSQQQQIQQQARNMPLSSHTQQSFSSVQQYPQRMGNPMGPGQNQPQMMGSQGIPQQLPQMGRAQRPSMQRNQLYVANQTSQLTPGSKMGYSPVPHGENKLHSGSNTHGHSTPLMVQQNVPTQFKMPGTGMMQGTKPQPGQPVQSQQQQQQSQHPQLQAPPSHQQQQQQQAGNGSNNVALNLDGSLASPHQGSLTGPQNLNGGGSGPNTGGIAASQAAAMKNNGATMAAQNEINAKIFKRNLGNAGVMRILDLIDIVSNEPHEKLSTLEFWTRFVQSYFAPNAVMRFTPAPASPKLPNDNYADGFNRTNPGRLYELDVLTAPRFLVASILSQNLTEHQVALPGIKSQVMNNGSVFIASRLNLQFTYSDGSVGIVQGTCRISLNKDYRIDWIDCCCLSYQTSITMNSLEKHWHQYRNMTDDKLDVSGGKGDFFERLCDSAQSVRTSSNSGIHDTAMRIMQIGDLMTYLKPLMAFSLTNGINLPIKALEGYMAASAGSHLQRIGSVSAGNGVASSPSPHTVAQDEPKTVLKKRRLSGSVHSPMNQEARRN